MLNVVLRVTLTCVAAIGVSACSPLSEPTVPSVTSPVPSTLLVGSMSVPPPWVKVSDDGTCTAELRTTPFDAASSVTLDAINGADRWTVSATDLGKGVAHEGACVFSIALDAPDAYTVPTYRLTVESSTRALTVTWDYPAEVVRSGAPLAMPLTDKVLVY